MSSSGQRIQTTHVGSLIRPPELVHLMRAKLKEEPVDELNFDEVLKHSVDSIVDQQISAGLDIVNDGEYGKLHWFRYVYDRLSGIEAVPIVGAKPAFFAGRDREQFQEFYAEYDKTQDKGGEIVDLVITGELGYRGQTVIQRDIANLKSAMKKSGAKTGFLPVVAPASVLPEFKDQFYGDQERCVFAIAEALREEYRAIVDAGLILQIDDAWLPSMYDRMVPPGTPDDYWKWAEMCVAALNHALRGIPEDRIRYHICWGSWNGPHTADLPLRDLVDTILKVNVGAYSIEGANPRHEHEWEVWRDVKLPEGRKLIPGVISHATNIVEHPELISQRVVRLANLIGRENVIAGTDCEFAQGAFYHRVHPSIMWAKLEALVEGAALASKKLWQ